jgi:hypothetical protein
MTMTKLQKIALAIEINGHLPVPASGGKVLHVRAIKVVNGKWQTDALTSNLMGYITIKRASQDYLVRVAEGIIARRDEITAERERSVKAALGQL